jgi:hypothetical protein
MARSWYTAISKPVRRRYDQVIAPSRDDLVIAVAYMVAWYWPADLCAQEGIPYVLGHAL